VPPNESRLIDLAPLCRPSDSFALSFRAMGNLPE
jgi:hypothetical protein